MLKDLRYSLRVLAKQPAFAAATILVLGLAVGVNTAVFSLMNVLLFRPLQVPEPEALGFVYRSNDRVVFPYEYYSQLQQRVDVFTGLAARGGDVGRLRLGNGVLPLQGEAVSANYFEVLRVTPRLGRVFSPSDDLPAAEPVAVISEALWKSQFAADAHVLGRTLRIDVGSQYASRYTGWRDYTIVGVMPASFAGTGNPWQPTQYWLPIAVRAEDHRAARSGRPLNGLADRPVVPFGRLKAGVTLAQAAAAVDAAGREILRAARFPTKNETFLVHSARRVRLPFQGAYFMDIPRITATLGAVATMLLIIAGVNLAGMLLARGVARRAEIAIRLSLGVGRVRLVRQLLAESLTVALGAGAVGLLMARVLIAAALHSLPSQIPGSAGVAMLVEVPIDWRVIAFAFGSGLLTATVVGLVPAVQAMRVDLLAALASGSASTGQTRSWLRRLVLVPQIALCLVLLLVTGVFVRAMLRLELTHPGYIGDPVVTLHVQFPQRQTETVEERRAESAAMAVIQDRVLERLAALPGVTSVALTLDTPDRLPLASLSTTIIARSDYETTRQYRGVTSSYVSADYFKTLGVPLIRGRVFDARDRADGTATVIVSERLADEIWPGQDPIGQQIAQHDPKSTYPIRWRTVVGLVGSVTRPIDEHPRPVFYSPIESARLMGTMFLVRGAGNPAELAATAKAAIAAAEPSLIVAQANPLAETVNDARYPRRFTAGILGASGFAALLLAAAGVFGLMSYAVAQRLREIGVRMVLGAQRRDVMGLILKDGALVAIAGVGLGFALAFAAIRYASHAIVPLPDADALIFIIVPAILLLTILAACFLPARRAARVDPLVVLRNS